MKLKRLIFAAAFVFVCALNFSCTTESIAEIEETQSVKALEIDDRDT